MFFCVYSVNAQKNMIIFLSDSANELFNYYNQKWTCGRASVGEFLLFSGVGACITAASCYNMGTRKQCKSYYTIEPT